MGDSSVSGLCVHQSEPSRIPGSGTGAAPGSLPGPLHWSGGRQQGPESPGRAHVASTPVLQFQLMFLSGHPRLLGELYLPRHPGPLPGGCILGSVGNDWLVGVPGRWAILPVQDTSGV